MAPQARDQASTVWGQAGQRAGQITDGANAGAARKRLRELGRHPTRRLVLGTAAAVAGGAVTWQMQPGNPLWWHLVGPGGLTFAGHEGPVMSVAFAPDGRTALSGSVDGMLRLWDLTEV